MGVRSGQFKVVCTGGGLGQFKEVCTGRMSGQFKEVCTGRGSGQFKEVCTGGGQGQFKEVSTGEGHFRKMEVLLLPFATDCCKVLIRHTTTIPQHNGEFWFEAHGFVCLT